MFIQNFPNLIFAKNSNFIKLVKYSNFIKLVKYLLLIKINLINFIRLGFTILY